MAADVGMTCEVRILAVCTASSSSSSKLDDLSAEISLVAAEDDSQATELDQVAQACKADIPVAWKSHDARWIACDSSNVEQSTYSWKRRHGGDGVLHSTWHGGQSLDGVDNHGDDVGMYV